jgi:hypothetical protein
MDAVGEGSVYYARDMRSEVVRMGISLALERTSGQQP